MHLTPVQGLHYLPAMLPVYTIINKTNLAAIAALSMLVFSGCGKDEPQYVEVQEVKESPAAQEQNMLSEMNQEAHAHAHDFFHYEKPSNWTEIGHSSMILMAFQAGNPPELVAEMQVSAFPGDVGGKLANINRWRRQVGLGPVDPEAVNDFITELEISELPAWQVSFTGQMM